MKDAQANDEKILARMEAIVRRIAGRWSHMDDGGEFWVAAADVARDLDRSRDPDIALAERIAARHVGLDPVPAILNGIKAGREAATGCQQGVQQ